MCVYMCVCVCLGSGYTREGGLEAMLGCGACRNYGPVAQESKLDGLAGGSLETGLSARK